MISEPASTFIKAKYSCLTTDCYCDAIGRNLRERGIRMRQRPGLTAALLVTAMVILQQMACGLWAQTTPPTAEELDQLLAPVALYPDALLSQIITASTNPQEILDVDNWLTQNAGVTGSALSGAAQQQGFDPAFIALTNFPQILEMMAQHVDDYAAIGTAFSADQATVSASIQRLRDRAYNAGALRSGAQQQVEVQQSAGQTIYIIQPANPQIVYVPVYDPTVVYVRSSPVAEPSAISFGLGIGIGALLVDNRPWGWSGWGWNWRARRAYYNHGYWGGWSNPYRPPRTWYRPRPIIWMNRPGYRGDWRYRPHDYRPPQPGNRPGYARPPYGPDNRPGYRPPGYRPGQPSIQPVKPGQPSHPSPGAPLPGRSTTPGQKRPSQPGQAPARPSKPAQPTNRPTPAGPTPPANGKRPQPQKPALSQPATRPGSQPIQKDRPQSPKPEPNSKPNEKPQPNVGSARSVGSLRVLA
jgi:Protein of unknown function (DUF3300)